MFKNNFKVLLFYILILGVTYGFLSAFNTLYLNSTTQLNNIIVKVFFIIFYISLFVLAGKLVGIKQNHNLDFFSFLLVFLIGLGLYFLAYLGGGLNFSENMNILMLPAQIFLSPFLLISSILGIDFNLLFYTVTSFIVTIVIGLSVRRSRVKRKYFKRKNNSIYNKKPEVK